MTFHKGGHVVLLRKFRLFETRNVPIPLTKLWDFLENARCLVEFSSIWYIFTFDPRTSSME